jgi:uncharacterized repeat protein (TIGR03803 family)
MRNSVPSRSGMPKIRLRATRAVLALAVVFAAGLVAAQSTAQPAYSFHVLYEFCFLANCADGTTPLAPVVQGTKGNLYGTAENVFKLTQKGTETVLYTFTYYGTDGTAPQGGLLRDSAGNLYGTTQFGGDLTCDAPYGCGVVFKVDHAGHETVLYSFHGGTDGMEPIAGVIRDSAGTLYGTTYWGGDLNCGFQYGCGTVFKLDTAGTETVLHSFTWGADSGFPEGGLVMDKAGNLYGTTYGNGTDTPGTVYKVTKAGQESVLYTFQDGNDGCNPMATLILDAKGNIYGTTSGNSNCNLGTVFKLTPKGKETVLYRFQGQPDGQQPQAGVVMDAAGNLYGTTYRGGYVGLCNGYQTNGCGTVFKVNKAGSETVLYKFKDLSDGGFPTAGVIVDGKGNLYGTTPYAGYSNYCPYQGEGCGVVFKLAHR